MPVPRAVKRSHQRKVTVATVEQKFPLGEAQCLAAAKNCNVLAVGSPAGKGVLWLPPISLFK